MSGRGRKRDMAGEPDIRSQIAELVTLGRGLFEQGKIDDAAELLNGLRGVDPGNFDVNKHLGIISATRGDFRGAIPFLEDALARRADDALTWNVQSVCVFEAGDYQRALACADHAIALQRQFAEAYNNRGNALGRLGRHEEALEAFREALALAPGDAVVLVNVANALRDLGRRDEALETIDRALRIDAQIPQAHCNRGNLLQDMGRHPEALQSYGAALALDPGSVDAHWNRSLCNLLLGNFEAGWRDYEWRWRRGAVESRPRELAAPLWLGETLLEGKTILLHCEQGLGDCLQFLRYAPQVAARGARVVVEAFAPLAELFRPVDGVAEVVVRGALLPTADFQCPLMSLPLALQAFAPQPGPPYLSAPLERLAAWRQRLGPSSGLRVGLVCSGSPTHGADRERSLPLARMLAALPDGAEYHLLQKAVAPGDQETLGRVRFWGDQIADFCDTAALIELMDLVVSVDTSVVHLAGALGRPARVLTAFDPDWRWGLLGDATAWYPSVEIRRQTTRGDWAQPLARVAEELTGLLALR
jgi:tetratricopeptide (TPR) repeat protein